MAGPGLSLSDMPGKSGRSPKPYQGPSRAGKIGLLIWTVLLVGAMAVGFPLMIVFGVMSLNHASDIKAHGITTDGYVTSQITGRSGCNGSNVSYLTAGGKQESGNIDQCEPVDAPVKLVYDPSAPNVVQLASHRGSTTGGWGEVIMGSFFTLLLYGLCLPGAAKQQLRRRRERHARAQAATA